MIVREMTIEDVPLLKLKEEWMYTRFINCFECHTGPAYIMEYGSEPVCAFGALFEWEWGGACEVWFNVIKNVKPFVMLRIMKRLLEQLAKQYKITRMQAIIDCMSPVNKKFIEFLGFRNETPFGMKNKLHNGNTAYMFSRIF
jgi:hypothetical protein